MSDVGEPIVRDETNATDRGAKFEPTGDEFRVASIELKGEKYNPIIDGQQTSPTETLERLVVSSEYERRLAETLDRRAEWLQPIDKLGYTGLLDLMQDYTRNLTFEEAYAAMTHVCVGSNKLLREKMAERYPLGSYQVGFDTSYQEAISLMKAASKREAAIGFTPDELAGLVAATLEIDTITRVESPDGDPVFAIGGMGGDRGILHDGIKLKTSNVSTLAMLGMAVVENVHKHHSYPNQSAVGGQSAIENLGARSDFSTQEALQTLMDEGLLASSCHSLRTVHTLSHVLGRETINHAIGPLAIPHAAEGELHPLIGVNEKLHPVTILETFKVLSERGVQRYHGGVAFCAIESDKGSLPTALLDVNQYYMSPDAKELIVLDEVAPPPYDTLASFLTRDGIRTVIIEPEDFLTEEEMQHIHPESLMVINETDEIIAANHRVVDGQDESQMGYVAMTMALGFFSAEACEHPEECFDGDHRVKREKLQGYYRDSIELVRKGLLRNRVKRYNAATKRVGG